MVTVSVCVSLLGITEVYYTESNRVMVTQVRILPRPLNRCGHECGAVTRSKNVRAHLKYYGLKHEGRNSIGAIKRIRTKLQISQPGKRESGQ